MQEQRHFSRKVVVVWCLVLSVLVQQVHSKPLPELHDSLNTVQEALRSLRRSARMTPLWRIMGTKPLGAYCQNNYECSTGICSRGHCVSSQPTKKS
ncbi:liver-expressed antimicrobial peptide 2 [Hoplias malabaricus]|uniref:liver-expressed antimicrobial peptide 2 n=1 Tax=Hoplias malabaricus TaxID=27720 RepID=UPI0034627D0E